MFCRYVLHCTPTCLFWLPSRPPATQKACHGTRPGSAASQAATTALLRLLWHGGRPPTWVPTRALPRCRPQQRRASPILAASSPPAQALAPWAPAELPRQLHHMLLQQLPGSHPPPGPELPGGLPLQAQGLDHQCVRLTHLWQQAEWHLWKGAKLQANPQSYQVRSWDHRHIRLLPSLSRQLWSCPICQEAQSQASLWWRQHFSRQIQTRRHSMHSMNMLRKAGLNPSQLIRHSSQLNKEDLNFILAWSGRLALQGHSRAQQACRRSCQRCSCLLEPALLL